MKWREKKTEGTSEREWEATGRKDLKAEGETMSVLKVRQRQTLLQE